MKNTTILHIWNVFLRWALGNEHPASVNSRYALFLYSVNDR